jgi:competence protein ComEC
MQIWKYIYGILTLGILVMIIAIFQLPDGNLHIIACDVGQGDAILMVYKNTQILTDGGPDKKVLNCLGKYLPFWDRDIELVISTHPDADHSTGLISVIEKYNVDTLFINPIDSGTQIMKVLENAVGSRGVKVVNPVEGSRYRLDLIYLDIVNPSREQIDILSEKVEGSELGFYKPIAKTNEYSISYRLSFRDFSGFFAGDVQSNAGDRIVQNPAVGSADYIKVPHHGSKHGLTKNLLQVIMPKVAVISVGKNNSYGHPSQETLEMLSKYGVKVYRTDEAGDIEIVTDGKKFWIKN